MLEQAKNKDKGRMWLYGFLAVVALSQLYIVQELFAAFVIFAIGFAALALVVATFYGIQKACELGVSRLAALRHPVMNMASVTTMASVGREDRKAA